MFVLIVLARLHPRSLICNSEIQKATKTQKVSWFAWLKNGHKIKLFSLHPSLSLWICRNINVGQQGAAQTVRRRVKNCVCTVTAFLRSGIFWVLKNIDPSMISDKKTFTYLSLLLDWALGSYLCYPLHLNSTWSISVLLLNWKGEKF